VKYCLECAELWNADTSLVGRVYSRCDYCEKTKWCLTTIGLQNLHNLRKQFDTPISDQTILTYMDM